MLFYTLRLTIDIHILWSILQVFLMEVSSSAISMNITFVFYHLSVIMFSICNICSTPLKILTSGDTSF
jgi:hypothetical protein